MGLKLVISKNQNNEDEYSFSGKSFNITKNKNALLKPYNKQVYNYGFRLQLLPNKEQTSNFNQQIGNARFVRNAYLDERIKYYEENHATLSVAEYMSDYLPKLKEENEFLKSSDKFALAAALESVDDAYKNFYKNVKTHHKVGKHKNVYGFPQFTSKSKPNGNRYASKQTNNNIKLLEIDNLPYIQIPKVGKVRYIMPNPSKTQLLNGKAGLENILLPNSRITSITISKEGKDFFVSLQLETIIDLIKPVDVVGRNDIYAMDMGVKYFGVYGNQEFSEFVANPRWIKVHQKRLRRLQKSLSRKQYDKAAHKGSKNYDKAKLKINKEHRKIKNQRNDFLHKLSRKIVNECNVFVCEDLNIKGMVSNHKLAKEISSCGWGMFLNYVKYKLEKKGGLFIKVDKFYASSKLCSKCGYKYDKLTLKVRDWTCPSCGTHHNRDENAKFNLLNEGIRLLVNDFNVKVV
jgi:putative transposase